MAVTSVTLLYVQVRLHFHILMCKLYFSVNLLLLDFICTDLYGLLNCAGNQSSELSRSRYCLGNIWIT
jgi:hypothetical protein